MSLPPVPDYAAFDAFHDDAAAWRDVIAEIAAQHSREPITQALDGTVLVALVGSELVVKLYPPFLADHFAFERAAMVAVHGKVPVPTPALLDAGERDGWPYLVMSQLHGRPLRDAWPTLSEQRRLVLLSQIGELADTVHALPAPPAPAWDDFIAAQRAGCVARQQRSGLPAHLLAGVERYIEGPVPAGASLLTGEYTPMNLLVDVDDPAILAGMYDFGDGLVGAREYDWLGPLAFMAAGNRSRRLALLGDRAFDAPTMLRLHLLHRYSNLRAQLAMPDWERARDLDALATLVFP